MEKNNKVMTPQQCRLVDESYQLLVETFKRKYWYLIPQENDLVGVFEEGLCLAALNFDESSKASFTTYAYSYVDGFIKNYLRDMIPHYEDEDRQPIFVSVVSIDSLVNRDDELNEEELTGEDLIPAVNPIDVAHQETMHERFKALTKGLTKKERKMLLSKHGFDSQKSIEEIAREMGISVAAVYKRIEKIEVKLARKADLISKAS